MQEIEFSIEETDIRALTDRLVQTGVPQTLDVLTEWYVNILVERLTTQE